MSLAEQLQKDIDEWCSKAFDDGPRSHLGASIIGRECERHLWYTWRWIKHKIFSGRMQRLFQDGHWYEDRIIEILRGIGCTVSQVGEDGNQHRIYAVQGHFGGSSDGKVTLPARYGQFPVFLTEFKTINANGFVKFHDVKNDKSEHWDQMCVYGVRLVIQYAIYFLVGKNDADLIIEVVELDWEHGERLISKGQRIIYMQEPPPRITNNPSDYRCKQCDHHGVCFMGVVPDVNCRSCRHSSPIDNKAWTCRRWNATIPSKQAMLEACPGYERLV